MDTKAVWVIVTVALVLTLILEMWILNRAIHALYVPTVPWNPTTDMLTQLETRAANEMNGR